MQTLEQAKMLAESGKSESLRRAAWAMHGRPVGAWGDTAQARQNLVADLPARSQRSYSASELIEAMYDIRNADARSSGVFHSKLDT